MQAQHNRWRSPKAAAAVLAAGFAVLGLAPPGADAQDLAGRLPALAEEHAGAAIAVRHHLHQHPELSNREVETSKRVAQELRALGLEVRTGIAHHGVVAVLQGGRPGPVVAVRHALICTSGASG